MNNIERQEQLKEISRYYPIPADFDVDTISWVTSDVAITSVGGAEEALLDDDCFVINVAEESARREREVREMDREALLAWREAGGLE